MAYLGWFYTRSFQQTRRHLAALHSYMMKPDRRGFLKKLLYTCFCMICIRRRRAAISLFTFHVDIECFNIVPQFQHEHTKLDKLHLNRGELFSSYSPYLLGSENKFAGQQRKHHSDPYIKTMIIKPLPSNRGFHSNCAASSLQCCKRSMMIYQVESVFVFVFNGFTALMKPVKQKSTNKLYCLARNYSPGF